MSTLTESSSLEFSSSSQRTEMQTSMRMIQLVSSDYCSIPFLRIPKKPHITMKNFEELIKPTPFNQSKLQTTSLHKRHSESAAKQTSKSSDLEMGVSFRRRAESSSPIIQQKKVPQSPQNKKVPSNYSELRSVITPKSRFAERST